MNEQVVLYSIIIFLTAFLGGLITIIKKWSDEFLHLFISFGAGIFLGLVFLHLLPEALSHAESTLIPLMVLAGFILIFFIERILFIQGEDGGDDNSHKVISITALVGLSVHSLIGGVGLAVGSLKPGLGWIIFLSIIAHKIPAAFALTSLFVLGKFTKKQTIKLLLIFSLMTPIGALALAPLFSTIGDSGINLLAGFTAGTFLYVATGDLLPEVFHTKDKRWVKLGLVLIGILFISSMGFLDVAHVGH